MIVISLVDIGYAAGFYDGEGSIIKHKEANSCTVSIVQKDPEPLVKLCKQFGGNIKTYNSYNYWRVTGTEARGFILTIFSLLSTRRKHQILECKEWFTTPDKCPNGHLYTESSYFMEQYGGRNPSRVCIECRKNHEERKQSNREPENAIAISYAKLKKISIEDAIKILAESSDEVN